VGAFAWLLYRYDRDNDNEQDQERELPVIRARSKW